MATELRSIPVNATNGPLDRRLHDIGWGLLLMLTGMVWLVPAERVPEGAWLLGVQPDLAHGPASAGDLSPRHRREPCGQAPSHEDHMTASAGGHP